MFVLLVGPKGSGKSYIGRTPEKHLGVTFFHVEPLWMTYHSGCEASCRQPNIPDGISLVHPHIAEALQMHEHLCVETTGASPEILSDLMSLEHPSKTLVARVSAPLELCLKRIASRDRTSQIPMELEAIREVHASSIAALVEPKVTLENVSLTETEIVTAFKRALTLS